MHGTIDLALAASVGAPAGEAHGLDLYGEDASLRALLRLRMEARLLAHIEPHLTALGREAGGRLDDLARAADRHTPILHHRDRHGRDRQSIEYHPAYRDMEALAFGRFGLAALSHRAGVFGWPEPLPPLAKYALTYLFAQAEFGLLCPVNMTDSMTRVLRRFADEGLLARYLPGLVSLDPEAALQGAMFMTEKAGGSDVGALETKARQVDGEWRLTGDKWFCSNADADLALVLARPEGAPGGTKGLGLFLLPRVLPDGRPNAYRVVRLKDKLGSRSMASGEIVLEGAVAYPVGDLGRGFVQMAEMVNASRLSNGVRAAGLMRRAVHEALSVCQTRTAFGRRLVDLPLQRRQLMKIILPAEEALSMALYAATVLERADGGEPRAQDLVRLLTPLIKFRACRDARKATGDAMEIRAGCGFVEDFVEPRLLRDAHLGSIWEGTSNIVALDASHRAVGRQGCERALADEMHGLLADGGALPEAFVRRLGSALDCAIAFARAVAATGDDAEARAAASGLYHAVAAVVLACEGALLAARGGDLGRALLSALVLRHRLEPRSPFAGSSGAVDELCAEAFIDGLAPDPDIARGALAGTAASSPA